MSGGAVRGHWSDGETWALVEAWGPRHLHRNGGSLDVAEWKEVCNAVNAHRAAAGQGISRSVVQCQKRVYTLKDQFKKVLAKGRPTPVWRHFAQLRAFLAGPDDGPPPGFAPKMPPAAVKEEVEEGEKKGESGGTSGSVGRRTVPAKRHLSSLQDNLDRSGGPPPGFPPMMPGTAKKAKVEKEEMKEEEVDGEGPEHANNGAAGAGWLPVMKLAEVYLAYLSVQMERLSLEKDKVALEREKIAAKMEAGNLRETDDSRLTHPWETRPLLAPSLQLKCTRHVLAPSEVIGPWTKMSSSTCIQLLQ